MRIGEMRVLIAHWKVIVICQLIQLLIYLIYFYIVYFTLHVLMCGRSLASEVEPNLLERQRHAGWLYLLVSLRSCEDENEVEKWRRFNLTYQVFPTNMPPWGAINRLCLQETWRLEDNTCACTVWDAICQSEKSQPQHPRR